MSLCGGSNALWIFHSVCLATKARDLSNRITLMILQQRVQRFPDLIWIETHDAEFGMVGHPSGSFTFKGSVAIAATRKRTSLWTHRSMVYMEPEIKNCIIGAKAAYGITPISSVIWNTKMLQKHLLQLRVCFLDGISFSRKEQIMLRSLQTITFLI